MLNLNNIKEFSPCILKINNAIEDCEEIINKAKNKKAFYDSKIDNNSVRKDIRNSISIDISPSFNNDKFWWILAQKLWQAGDFYGKKYDISFSFMEDPSFLWYKKNEGFYVPHVDSGKNDSRIFSLILYLNNVKDGGETYFEHLGFSFKPEAGTIILFPANFAYLHGAKKPISEDKNIIVTWFHS